MDRRAFLARSGALAAAASGAARAQGTREIVDDAGRKVRVPARVTRVFAAGPPASILVFAVAPDALTGWTTAFRPAERPFVAAKYADLPVTGRLTGRGSTANVEAVVASRPDVVVDYGAVNPTYVSLADRVQQQTGIPYLLLDGAFDRIGAADAHDRRADGRGGARRVARALRRRTRRRHHASRRERSRRRARPRVYYGRGPRGLDTGARRIDQHRSHRPARRAQRRGRARARRTRRRCRSSRCSLWNPDVVVTTDPNFFASVRRDPLWRAVAAVRSGRIHLAPAVPFGWIDFPPSVNRLIGLRWLARVLYPDVFPEDLRPVVRDFYTRCYHRTPTDAQLDALLAHGRACAGAHGARARRWRWRRPRSSCSRSRWCSPSPSAASRSRRATSRAIAVVRADGRRRHGVDPTVETIVWSVRGPRIGAALAVGAALAAAGAAYQSLFRNPLVSPDILGVSSGAAVGAVLGIFLSLPVLAIQGLAFVVRAGRGRARVRWSRRWCAATIRCSCSCSPACSSASLLGACVALLKCFADPYNQLPAITFWLLGSLAGAAPADLATALPAIVARTGAARAAALAHQRARARRRRGARARRRDRRACGSR